MMILDHWMYTQNKTALVRYFPILAATLDFFSHHHKNRTADGEMVIWPTQALETYWCAWKPFFNAATNESNCIVNDHPTVAALHVLCERALTQLPADVGTTEQRAQWTDMQKILPPLPVTIENGIESVSPYGSYPINNALHNGETPELYSVHPVSRPRLCDPWIPLSHIILSNSHAPECCSSDTSRSGGSSWVPSATFLQPSTVCSTAAQFDGPVGMRTGMEAGTKGS